MRGGAWCLCVCVYVWRGVCGHALVYERCGTLSRSLSLAVKTCACERAFMACRHRSLSACSVDAFFLATVAARLAVDATFLASACRVRPARRFCPCPSQVASVIATVKYVVDTQYRYGINAAVSNQQRFLSSSQIFSRFPRFVRRVVGIV